MMLIELVTDRTQKTPATALNRNVGTCDANAT